MEQIALIAASAWGILVIPCVAGLVVEAFLADAAERKGRPVGERRARRMLLGLLTLGLSEVLRFRLSRGRPAVVGALAVAICVLLALIVMFGMA